MIKDHVFRNDINDIISHRYDQGYDYFLTSDMKFIKGSPFSFIESIHYLLELNIDKEDPLIKKCSELLWSAQKSDGRFKLVPKSTIYPCHTAHAVRLICELGFSSDERTEITFKHLLETQSLDGGWRCNKFSYGKGDETLFSNPFPTLNILNAFRFSNYLNNHQALDRAVIFLLEHWDIKKPIGPCHYGIGSLFMQVEYPFRNYNLFYYVYVLSFYDIAKKDRRFIEALNMLKSKVVDQQLIIERNVSKLAKLKFCEINKPSTLATLRFNQIIDNIKQK